MHASTGLSQRATRAESPPISDLMARALEKPDLISLAAGFVDQQTLPAQATRAAFEAIFSDESAARAALQYGTTPGYPPLREAVLADYLQAERLTVADAGISLNQVVLTAGSNQLLHLVCESLLDPGDIVLCAAPTYLVFLATLQNLGAQSIAVASDEQGMIPQALAETLRRLEHSGQLPKVKAIYLVPYYENPTGATLPADRREEIVQLAQQWSKLSRLHVIEDAAYRELRYEGDDVLSLRRYDDRGDTVIVAGTFSKSYSPGIRVGWGLLPPHLVDPVCNQKGNIDFGSPNFSQHLMSKVMELGLFRPHVQQLRDGYRVKLRAMLRAADTHLAPIRGVRFSRPTGGLYVWLQLPEGVDAGPSGKLFGLALGEGMLYVPGEYCYAGEGEPKRNNRIRLSFGVQSCENIERGIAALGRAIRHLTD